jgi:hypothetical protein
MIQQTLTRWSSLSFVPLVAGLTVVLLLGESPRLASALDLDTKEKIVNLMLCYGAGTDAIGNSTLTNPGPRDAGVAIYAKCFTDDAVFRAWFPGTDFSDPLQAVTVGPTGTQTGPEAWADFVFGVFNGTYAFTQHSLSNFMVEVSGTTGTLTAYLDAAHVKQAAGLVTGVNVAHGTYTLQVKKIGGRWKVTHLDLTLINFTPFNP